jgi:flagellar motor protein MotB
MALCRARVFWAAAILAASGLFAQGPDTRASRDDWEEINFEFNSSVLVDGFPSLLRLAELLQQNAGYRVRVEGHTDGIGSNAFNQRLGLARANAVRDFLVKYGARPAQAEAVSQGEASPRAPGQGTVFRPTDEARYMNRRVVLTVFDAQGRPVGAGGAGDAIRAMADQQKLLQQSVDCCNEVLKRLDKLDEIAKMLRDLADQNAALRKELADLRQNQDALQKAQAALQQNQNTLQQGQQATDNRINQLPSAGQIATAAADEVDRRKDPRFQLLGVNVGPDGNGDVTFSGRGRFFAPFGDRIAFQAQGEYMYWKTQREGQFDVGLVDRLGRRVQAGLFASFKHVTLTGNQSGVTLGQAALTVDYLFSRGRVGLFGTKGFMDNGVINRANRVSPAGVLYRNIIEERYLRIVDQAGVSGTVGLLGNTYLVGNAGYLKSAGAGDRFGGTLRLVFPINSKIAFTAEGGVNETLLARDNNGRAAFGLQFGNFLPPKDYLDSGRPVPAEVPRVRYEVLTRMLRVGNDPPVADAGPDLSNVQPGAVQLDGSNSYDPDGDPITFEWSQESGSRVSLSNAASARPSFTAAAGELYTFRLVVRDDHGGQGSARVRISTRSADRVQILFFIADPREIPQGATSTLSWRVLNADTVSIGGVGNVAAQGSAPVSPSQTTTYTLTARNSVNEETATATVVVTAPAARLLYCYAQPASIVAGDTATLHWSAPNAATVTIEPGIGAVARTGSVTVTPTQTTAYTITAVGPNNTSQDSCGVVVTVTPGGGLPRIIRFSATPATINTGQSSTLLWVVENADKVNITALGDVPINGAQDVSPAQTTTYTLTATNRAGSATATTTVTVNVIPPVRINSFTAEPAVSPSPGSRVFLTCDTTGATTVHINNILFLPPRPTAVVFPTATTTYTCVATGPSGQTDTKTVTVTVTQPTTPTTNNPTVVIAGGNFQETIYRDIIIDASQSFSPIGNNPLTFFWTSRQNTAVILDPDSPRPRVQLPLNAGQDHLFDVVVTDSKGNRTLVTVTIRYKGVN